MATEVKHGPNPVFETPLTGATFICEVVGRYTKVPDRGAGGVTAYHFNSDNPRKRRAELLVLRTAFLEWFREMYEANGGSRHEAVRLLDLHWVSRPGALRAAINDPQRATLGVARR